MPTTPKARRGETRHHPKSPLVIADQFRDDKLRAECAKLNRDYAVFASVAHNLEKTAAAAGQDDDVIGASAYRSLARMAQNAADQRFLRWLRQEAKA